MDDLIRRLEKAEADQYDLIGAAIIHAHDNGWINNATYDRAILMLNAGAYESAALTLVPEEWTAWSIDSRGNKSRFVVEISKLIGDVDVAVVGRAATPALAICAAALKAQKEEG